MRAGLKPTQDVMKKGHIKMKKQYIPTGFMANNRHGLPKKPKKKRKIGGYLATSLVALTAIVGPKEIVDTALDTVKYIGDQFRYNAIHPQVVYEIKRGDTAWALARAEIGKDDSGGNHTRNLRDTILRINNDPYVIQLLKEKYGTYSPVKNDSQLIAGALMIGIDVNGDGRFGH
jgi:hypothetical protein